MEEVTQRAKELFGLKDREARLLRGGRPLVAEESASRQLIGCQMVELDMLCQFLTVGLSLSSELQSGGQTSDQPDPTTEAAPAVEPPSEGEVLRRFASDPARSLCADAESRVTSWASGESVSGNSPLHTVVPEEALICGTVVGVFTE